ncbi:thiamine biosynthesis protein ThiF [Desulfosarcina widdelii]|uniref:Thiamine biosynthesis protein ThiF n=1 Tax=Desulfosarcina widdelii TaxID=947919 RepID=A0A5K7ZDH5_9BACT|nr:sulfur carrier protein ThiS adenylyltransferase ThiF [Desulfosarcina widdelii]BBO78860.1 thiamine biosynthesis protein ThiF [Desulfosarcina widdelii]
MTENHFRSGLKAHFSEEQIQLLASVRVGIAGAGGLGSNAAAHLVRSGIRRLVVADFDRVEASNLNRQFYFADQLGLKKVAALKVNLLRIDPSLEMESVDLRLDAANIRHTFRNCTIVLEALDRARDKKMMADCFLTDSRLFVCASGIGGWGDADRIHTRKIGGTNYVVGDGRSETSAAMPPTAAIVGIAAAKQADIVVAAILNKQVGAQVAFPGTG